MTTGKGMAMDDAELLARISIDREVMVGKPVIRGTRLTVEHMVGLLAHGMTIEGILAEYEGLQREDIHACLLFATKSMQDTTFMPLAAETT